MIQPAYKAIALALCAPSVAFSEDVHIEKQLNDALFNGQPSFSFQYPDGNKATCKRGDDLFTTQFSDNYGGYCVIVYSEPRYTQKSIQFTPAGVPDSVALEDLTWLNCASLSGPLPVNDTMSITTSEGATVSTTTTVVDSKSISAGGNIGINIGVVRAGVDVKETVNYSTTTGTSTTKSLTTTKTDTRTIRFDVPPQTARRVQLEKQLSTEYFEYDGVFVIDAKVALAIIRSDGVRSETNVPYGSVSQYTPDENARTFHLKGRISNVSSTVMRRKDTDYSLKGKLELCPSDPENNPAIIKLATPSQLLK